jgi:hypothetical protein
MNKKAPASKCSRGLFYTQSEKERWISGLYGMAQIRQAAEFRRSLLLVKLDPMALHQRFS